MPISHFVGGWHLLRCHIILFLPPPPKWFFSAGYYFSQVFLYKLFSPRNQSAGWNHPAITPLKVKWLAPKIHQTFALLTDSDLSIVSKALWNSRGQNSLGERGGIHFYLPLPGESVRMYVDVITKFSQMDSLPNFLSYGAMLALGLCTLIGSAMTYSVQLILYLVPLYFHFVLWVQNTMYNYELEVCIHGHLPLIHCSYRSDVNISSNLWNIRDLVGCLYFVFK